jgi:hypothetical protein
MDDSDQDLDKIPVTADEAPSAFAYSPLRVQVDAILTRRAFVAGLSDVAYLREMKAGRAPLITYLEASREAAP